MRLGLACSLALGAFAACAPGTVASDVGPLPADTGLYCSGCDWDLPCGAVGSPTCTECSGRWMCGPQHQMYGAYVCHPSTVPPADYVDLPGCFDAGPRDASAD